MRRHRVISIWVGQVVKQTSAEQDFEESHLWGRHRQRKPQGRLGRSRQRGGRRRKAQSK